MTMVPLSNAALDILLVVLAVSKVLVLAWSASGRSA
jgi:hypothetical protein